MKYGLTVAQVYQQISEKLKSETTSTTITSNSNDLAVVIKNNASETTIKDLKLLEIKGTKNNKDAKVKLNKIATITNATTPASINHKNQTRYMTVSASVDEDHNIGLISRDIQSKIDDYNTPNGYEVELTGENETISSYDTSCNSVYLFNNGCPIPITIISIYRNVHYSSCIYWRFIRIISYKTNPKCNIYAWFPNSCWYSC